MPKFKIYIFEGHAFGLVTLTNKPHVIHICQSRINETGHKKNSWHSLILL